MLLFDVAFWFIYYFQVLFFALYFYRLTNSTHVDNTGALRVYCDSRPNNEDDKYFDNDNGNVDDDQVKWDILQERKAAIRLTRKIRNQMMTPSSTEHEQTSFW